MKPAVQQLHITPQRADLVLKHGRITDQMFESILREDFCIALLHNPNVFYELAIAQAAGKLVILMVQKGEDFPLDVKDLRCGRYDLKPRPLFEGKYSDE